MERLIEAGKPDRLFWNDACRLKPLQRWCGARYDVLWQDGPVRCGRRPRRRLSEPLNDVFTGDCSIHPYFSNQNLLYFTLVSSSDTDNHSCSWRQCWFHRAKRMTSINRLSQLDVS